MYHLGVRKELLSATALAVLAVAAMPQRRSVGASYLLGGGGVVCKRKNVSANEEASRRTTTTLARG